MQIHLEYAAIEALRETLQQISVITVKDITRRPAWTSRGQNDSWPYRDLSSRRIFWPARLSAPVMCRDMQRAVHELQQVTTNAEWW